MKHKYNVGDVIIRYMHGTEGRINKYHQKVGIILEQVFLINDPAYKVLLQGDNKIHITAEDFIKEKI